MLDIKDIQPKNDKSNLNIKARKRRQKKIRESIKNRINRNIEIMKNADVIFGLDNGATGTISCIVPYDESNCDIYFDKTFANLENDYQKDSQKIARIDWEKLKKWFEKIIKKSKSIYYKKYNKKEIKISIVLERPMINVERFKQSKNAARAFESTLVVIEMLKLKNNYIIIDSKKWQHYFFGKHTVSLNLKEESKNKGIEYLNSINHKKYKSFCNLINAHGDADSLLICKFALEKLR